MFFVTCFSQLAIWLAVQEFLLRRIFQSMSSVFDLGLHTLDTCPSDTVQNRCWQCLQSQAAYIPQSTTTDKGIVQLMQSPIKATIYLLATPNLSPFWHFQEQLLLLCCLDALKSSTFSQHVLSLPTAQHTARPDLCTTNRHKHTVHQSTNFSRL